MFNWWRSRIICKGNPQVSIQLFRRETGMTPPRPMLWVTIDKADIFTRQPNGHFWLTGQLIVRKEEILPLRIEPTIYTYCMSLRGLHTFEYHPSDWKYWENNGELLLGARLRVNIHINDRRAKLVDYVITADCINTITT